MNSSEIEDVTVQFSTYAANINRLTERLRELRRIIENFYYVFQDTV